MTNRSLMLATLALALCIGPRPASAEPAYSLRARGADAHTLLRLLSNLNRKNALVGPGVQAKLRVDLRSDSVLQIQDEVVREAGARAARLGRFLFIDAPERVEVAKAHPVLRLLDKGGYEARTVNLDFDKIPLLRLLVMLSDVSKRPFEVGEGVDARVSVTARNVPWNEVLDVLVAAGNLTRVPVDRSIRVSRRGDRAPKFSAVRPDPKAEPRETGRTRCPGPLGDFSLAAMSLVATLTGLEDPVALVSLPDGSQHTARRGSCIGDMGGVVSAVEPDRLKVSEFQVGEDRVSLEKVERILELEAP